MISKDRRRPRRGAARRPRSDHAIPELVTPPALYRVIYSSEFKEPGAEASPAGVTVHDIARGAARKNASLQISGALVAIRGFFLQVLEGELEPLEEVFERICCDFRHRKLSLIDFSPTTERRFAEWKMVSIDSSELPDSEPLEDLLMSVTAGMTPLAIVEEVAKVVDESRASKAVQHTRARA